MSTASTSAAMGTDITVTFVLPYRASYSGSRAQLEAEGIIPADLEWPERTAEVNWMVGDLQFSLRRARPEGIKGPMAVWINGDHWCLGIEVHGRDFAWHDQRKLKAQADALATELHRRTQAGRREFEAHVRRMQAANHDKAFQVFKTLILPKRARRGRPPKIRAD